MNNIERGPSEVPESEPGSFETYEMIGKKWDFVSAVRRHGPEHLLPRKLMLQYTLLGEAETTNRDDGHFRLMMARAATYEQAGLDYHAGADAADASIYAYQMGDEASCEEAESFVDTLNLTKGLPQRENPDAT